MALCLLFLLALTNSLKVERNNFQMLNVTPTTPVEQIKKSFKGVAMQLHPDRNTTTTSSEEYMKLVQIYRFLIDNNNREAYNRYGDLINSNPEKLRQMSPVEVLYVVFINSSTSLIGLCLAIFFYGNRRLNWAALNYELFCFAIDIYLRLSPTEMFFLWNLPILRYYTIFELIAFLRNFRIFFMYYPTIYGKDEGEGTSLMVALSILKNNSIAIKNVDDYMKTAKKLFPAIRNMPIMPHDTGSGDVSRKQEEAVTNDSAYNSSGVTAEEGEFYNTSLNGVCNRIKWDQRHVNSLLSQGEAATNPGSSLALLLVYLLPLVASMVLYY